MGDYYLVCSGTENILGKEEFCYIMVQETDSLKSTETRHKKYMFFLYMQYNANTDELKSFYPIKNAFFQDLTVIS